MTSPMDVVTVPWPKPDEFGYAFDELSAKDAALRFQRARYEAAMQRLRVAVKILNLIAADTDWDGDDSDALDNIACLAEDVIEVIGPLSNDDAKGA